ncbi:hypothetical protein AB3S75_035784 [Citrus x aurantiifolia]
MGESAVLLRSFSHPSDASREGDPIRALTESISFGRFMSESLAWEKWSTFSHNRYLEEVERFSKPGTVAEKKAYFEAHYKKKAAMKAAAAVEEANAAANEIPGLKTTTEILDNSPTDTDSAKENRHMAIKEQKEQHFSHTSADSHMDTVTADEISHVVADDLLKSEGPNAEVAPTEANVCYSINTEYDLGDADLKKGEAVIEYAVNVENPTQDDNLKQLQNLDFHYKIEASSLERMPNKEVADEENSASSSKKKLASCSSKLPSESGLSRFVSYKTNHASSLPAARNVNNITASNEEAVGDSNGKKRVVPKSLQKSFIFSPRTTETSKASLKKPKDSSTPIRTPTRASVNGISMHLSKLFQSEDKRSKIAIGSSVSGGIAEAGRLQCPSPDLKSSTSNGSKRRSPCITSPFSFRSDERVAKRKEKLEEKNKANEAEKGRLETRSKDKAECDIKKGQQSTSFEAKQNKDLCCGYHLPNAHMKKEKAEHDIKKLRQSTGFKSISSANCPLTTKQIKKKPLCQPCSPKLGGKPRPTPTVVLDSSSRPPRKPSVNTGSSKTCSVTSLPKLGRRPTSNTVQDAHARPLWRSSMNTGTFKRTIDKNSESTNRSVTSLPKKNARENASPNIQV